MVLLQFAILLVIVLLLVRSINHDNRMDKMERFMGKIVKSIRGVEQHTDLMQDPIYNSGYSSVLGDYTEDDVEQIEEVLEETTDDISGT